MAETSVSVKQAPRSQPTAAQPSQSFRTEIDRLFDRFSSGLGFPSFRRMFDVEPFWRDQADGGLAIPAVDVSEDENSYKITAELPGMSEKDIDLSLNADVLTLKGEKRQEHEEKSKNRYLSERSYGSFQRSFYLPQGVAQDKITARFNNGVLAVTLPKTNEAQAQQRKIDVKTA